MLIEVFQVFELHGILGKQDGDDYFHLSKTVVRLGKLARPVQSPQAASGHRLPFPEEEDWGIL